MSTSLTTPSSLNIRRVQAEYLLARQHPAPERLKAQLDETVTHSLAQALLAGSGPQFADTDTSIWLIRRLQVMVEVNANGDREMLARTWARQINRALEETFRAGGDGENVLWFPNRAAFLACFLADVAHGSAWGKWQYEQFEGLRPLPVSAALRTAICEAPGVGLAALQQLTPADLRQVLAALAGTEARRVLDRLAEVGPAGERLRNWHAAWSAWEKLDPGVTATGESPHTLHLFLIATQLDDQAGGPALVTAVLTLTRLAHRLAHHTLAQNEALLALLTGGDLARLYLASPAEAEAFGPLLECPPEWVRQVGEMLLARRSTPAPAQPDLEPERRETAFGGLFLLLPFLDELPLAEATTGWPEAEETPAPALLRLLLFIKCCGPGRASRVFYDPLVRELLGVPASLTLAGLAAWHRRITAQNRRTLLAALGRWQSAQGIMKGEIYLLARASGGRTPLAVLLDGGRGVWLNLWPYRPGRLGRWAGALRAWLEPGERAAPLLLGDPRLLEIFGGETLPGPIISLADPAVQTFAESNLGVRELLARLDKLPADLAYLAFPPSFGLKPSLDRTLSIAAQGLLRNFAWRLPGFAFSSVAYLYPNFLDFTASLVDAPDRRVVRLGRPPLHLVLNMTGLARSSYHLSWLDERPLALFQQQE